MDFVDVYSLYDNGLLGFAHECRFFLAPASLLPSPSTSKAKRGKYGKSKGKTIDPNVGFNSWKVKEDEKIDSSPDEATPTTRKRMTIVFVLVAR
jgi:hypothetical protein